MSIDQYQNTFEYLVNADLPEYLKMLEVDMQNPKPMSSFAIEGTGTASLCRQLGIEEDFAGCYVLLDNSEPIYVGISGSVLRRLRQHVRGTTHFDASLAYRIACQHISHNQTRAEAMETEPFKTEFIKAKDYLCSLHVAFVPINNPLVLYVFEPYCAMKFDTGTWNTFKTH